MAEEAAESSAPPDVGRLIGRQPSRTLGLLVASAAAWAFLAWLAFDMDSGFAQLTMPGSAHWTLASALAILGMWAVMMAAMMLPSTLPTVLTFAQLSLCGGDAARAASFVAGYLLVWSAFSVAATAAQWALQAAGWVDPMIVSRSPWLTAVLLLVAGVYQFSPLKQACLSACRSPLGFLLGRWRAGSLGALAMGIEHGAFCLGCCWALMALLFVGGVMNLAWIAALAIAVAIEKLGPAGRSTSTVLGLALLAAGGWKLLATAL